MCPIQTPLLVRGPSLHSPFLLPARERTRRHGDISPQPRTDPRWHVMSVTAPGRDLSSATAPHESDTGQPGLFFPHWLPPQHDCSFTSGALGLSKRGVCGGVSDCQCSHLSSINHVINN